MRSFSFAFYLLLINTLIFLCSVFVHSQPESNSLIPQEIPSNQIAPIEQTTAIKKTASIPSPALKSPTEFADDDCGVLAKYMWQPDADRQLPDGMVPHELVLNCYIQFPFNESLAWEAADTVMNGTKYYVFSNLTDQTYATDRKTVEGMVHRGFTNDLRFNEALSGLLISYYDGHLQYTPHCYRKFSYFLPIYLLAVVDEDIFTRIILHAVDQFAPPELSEYVGGEVLLVDFVAAHWLIEFYSNYEYGCCRNRRTRFTRMFSSMMLDPNTGRYKLDRGYWAKRKTIPLVSTVKLRVRKPKTLEEKDFEVSWFALLNEKLYFNDNDSYWKNYCIKSSSTSDENAEKNIANSVEDPADNSIDNLSNYADEQENSAEPLAAKAVKSSIANNTSLQIPTPIIVGPGFAFFIKDGGDIVGKFGILAISTFACLSSNVKEWHMQMYKGFKELEEQGAKRILLDVSNNGGGRICLAYSLVALFSPSKTARFPIPDKPFKTVISASQTVLDVISIATKAEMKDPSMRTVFSLSWFLDPDTLEPLENPDEFLSNKKVRERKVLEKVYGLHGMVDSYRPADRKQLFTKPLIDNCFSKNLSPLANYTVYTKDVIIMSNGYSGSSAAIVTANLQMTGITTVVFSTAVVKDNLHIKQTPFSFAGGQVMSVLDLYNALKKLNMSDQYSFGNYPTQADATFTYRAIFTEEEHEEALEFQAAEANVEVRLTPELALNMERIWQVAMEEGGAYNKWWPKEEVGKWRAEAKPIAEIIGKGGGQLMVFGHITSGLSEDFQSIS